MGVVAGHGVLMGWVRRGQVGVQAAIFNLLGTLIASHGQEALLSGKAQ